MYLISKKKPFLKKKTVNLNFNLLKLRVLIDPLTFATNHLPAH